jgi:membrane-associated phospholipid phosphatase
MINFKTPEKLLLIGVILALLSFSFIALMISKFPERLSWDSSLLLAIHNSNQPILDQIATTTTNLGNLGGIMMLSTPIFIFLGYQKRWQVFAYLMTTILSSALVNLIVKLVFHRLRPHLWELFYIQNSFSFPSGHAMGSMTLIVALLLITRGTIWNTICLILGSLYVLLIAWTRLYLGVHYPSDILGGWLLAIVWTVSIYLLFNRFNKHQLKSRQQ